MTDATTSSHGSLRPRTPHASPLLKTIRYEDTLDGRPPVPVATVNQHTSTSSSMNSPAHSTEAASPKRPEPSATTRNDRASALSTELKRDSGVAPSLSTTRRASYAESHQSSAAGANVTGLAPSLPTIVVQDEASPDPLERIRSPFGRKRSRDYQRKSELQSPPGVQRVKSFKGIETSIPSGELQDISLEDLASEKVGFSQRGSLLFGGRKMNEAIVAQGDGACDTVSPTESGMTKQGLVPGRRKPSVHMLQAAMQQGRVLSADEITFSMRVRTMYDHGDEKAADWVLPISNGTVGRDPPETLPKDESTSDVSMEGITIGKKREPVNGQSKLNPIAQPVRTSHYTKQSKELAGGVEDWEDLDGQDVDRYGFIVPKGMAPRNSTASYGPSEGIHRVATKLRLAADQPRKDRKLKRGPSDARSARPLRPTSNGGNASVHSLQSGNTGSHRANPFRSKDNRIMDEASDMLTFPRGLGLIAEDQEAPKAAERLRKTEWARNDKWRKMARPVRNRAEVTGGGMQCDFNTADPKLAERTWKGIPDRWRAAAWHSFLSTSAKRRGPHATDEELIAEFHKFQDVNSAEDVQIDLDVPRTINMHIMFRRRYRGGQRLLFRVLHAISLYFPDTGYVQGMAALAATLLCYYDEERAFVMMVRMWQLRGLEQLFQNGFEGLLTALGDFEKYWLRGGDVAQKLVELSITSTAWGTRWYLTLFNMSIPFPAQLRVWDIFMLQGDASPPNNGNAFGGADLDVLHATSAALIDATRDIILDSDFESAMKILTSFIPIQDEDLLMRVARAEWKMQKKRAGWKT